jgi:hypothetical protein
MRMLLRVSIPVESGNAAIKAGTIGSITEKILADLKPEAASLSLGTSIQRKSHVPANHDPQDLAKAGPR